MFKKIYYNILGCFLLASSAAMATEGEQAPANRPLIVTSIKPLAIIAKSAVTNAADVQYLLPANQSPHDYTMPVSALKKIAKADLVVWVGESFETRSAKTMAKLIEAKRITAMAIVATESAQQGYSDSHNKNTDPHIWLNPKNGNKIAAEIQKRLGLPVKQIISDELIQTLTADMAVAFAGDKSYLSHHDAYGHFVSAFDLPLGLSLRDTRGGVLGVKSQYQLRKTILNANISCVFVEPQYQDKDATNIAAEFEVPLVTLDPQGLSQALGDKAYSEFIGGLAEQFKACFQ